MKQKIPVKKWKKVLTREYSFLYINYALEVFKNLKSTLGTELKYQLLYGKDKITTIYRIEEDIKRSYKLIDKIVEKDENEILSRMDKYEKLVKNCYQLIQKINKEKNKNKLKKYLLDLSDTFQETLYYYLFFVYFGYASDYKNISNFLKKYNKRFDKIRMFTIDTDIDGNLPMLWARYDSKLKNFVSYMTPEELSDYANSKNLDKLKIIDRKKSWLVLLEGKKIKVYNSNKVDFILNQQLVNLDFKNANSITGQIAQKGIVKGRARIVISQSDYEKKINKGDIIITPMTKPSIVPFLSKVAGIITDDGGALCHASIISRELKKPCIVGTIHATEVLKDGDLIELDANKGVVRKLS